MIVNLKIIELEILLDFTLQELDILLLNKLTYGRKKFPQYLQNDIDIIEILFYKLKDIYEKEMNINVGECINAK